MIGDDDAYEILRAEHVACIEDNRKLTQERDALKAHVEKLVEIFEADGMPPCNDSCALGGILAWVDPADFERVRELRDELREESVALKKRLAESGGMQGHGEPCYMCENPCDALAGNPADWPIPLVPVDGEPGVVKWHCIGCVRERLQHASDNERTLKISVKLNEIATEISIRDAAMIG